MSDRAAASHPAAATGAGREDGSGSVWVLCLMLVMGSVAGVLVVAGGAAARRSQVAAAADLAALGAADVLQHLGTPAQACLAAARIASLNAATVQSCVVQGEVVGVVVVATRARFGFLARADARAGPVPGG